MSAKKTVAEIIEAARRDAIRSRPMPQWAQDRIDAAVRAEQSRPKEHPDIPSGFYFSMGFLAGGATAALFFVLWLMGVVK